MFNRSRSISIAVGALAALTPVVALAGPASAGQCGDEMITANVSDKTPASGQQFIVRGKFVIGAEGAADHVVKIQSKLSGTWEPIKGARMTTDSEGKYRLRLVLSAKGERQLRVVGV